MVYGESMYSCKIEFIETDYTVVSIGSDESEAEINALKILAKRLDINANDYIKDGYIRIVCE